MIPDLSVSRNATLTHHQSLHHGSVQKESSATTDTAMTKATSPDYTDVVQTINL